jgi:hypothetical protein
VQIPDPPTPREHYRSRRRRQSVSSDGP